MKTKEEILNKYYHQDMIDYISDDIFLVMSEVEQQIKKDMFEFIEWFAVTDICTIRINGIQLAYELNHIVYKDLDSLFEYWKSIRHESTIN